MKGAQYEFVSLADKQVAHNQNVLRRRLGCILGGWREDSCVGAVVDDSAPDVLRHPFGEHGLHPAADADHLPRCLINLDGGLATPLSGYAGQEASVEDVETVKRHYKGNVEMPRQESGSLATWKGGVGVNDVNRMLFMERRDGCEKARVEPASGAGES